MPFLFLTNNLGYPKYWTDQVWSFNDQTLTAILDKAPKARWLASIIYGRFSATDPKPLLPKHKYMGRNKHVK